MENITRAMYNQVADAMVEAWAEKLEGNAETANAYMNLVVGKAKKNGFSCEVLEQMNEQAKLDAVKNFCMTVVNVA